MENDNNNVLTENGPSIFYNLLGYSPTDLDDSNAIDLSHETINNEALHASTPAMKAPFDEHVGSLLKILYGEETAVVEVLN